MWIEKAKIRERVASMLEVNPAIQDSEKVLVMTDPLKLGQWQEFTVKQLGVALEKCVLATIVADIATELLAHAEASFLPYLAVQRPGDKADPETAKIMRTSDVIIAITNYSLSHTMAPGNTLGKKLGICSQSSIGESYPVLENYITRFARKDGNDIV